MSQTVASKDDSDLLSRLPPDILASLTADQRAALWALSRSSSWKRKPVNIRLSYSLFGRRMFLTIVGGSERRSNERVNRDRQMHQLRTRGNLLFIAAVIGGVIVISAAIYVAAQVFGN